MNKDPEIDLRFGKLWIGSLTFPRATFFSTRRTIDGVVLIIPARLLVKMHDEISGVPVVYGLRARVSSFGCEIGVAVDSNWYSANTDGMASLELALRADVVRAIERLRNGGPMELALALEGSASVLRQVEIVVPDEKRESQPIQKAVIGEPKRFHDSLTLSVDPIAWVGMLNVNGFGDNAVVEIPLPPNPGPPWDDVWKAVRTARDALNRGGETAWKTVVTECRLALEKWQNFESPDHGPGWTAPSRQDREARTKEQRRDNLRWDLVQCAHEAAHSHADKWTRDDAVLVLAALTALLAARKP